MDQILILKLVSGEEIIGNSISTSTWAGIDYALENVFVISTRITSDGKALQYLDPFILGTNDSMLTFQKNHVITVARANTIAVNYYLQVVDSLKDAKQSIQNTFDLSQLN